MNDFALPLTLCTRIERDYDSVIYVPEVIGHWNVKVQHKINERIDRTIDHLIEQQYIEQNAEAFEEMIGTYELKANERNVLSVTLQNYAYAYRHAHGLTLMESLTLDVLTGKTYELADFFKSNSNFLEVLTKLVNEQIKARNIPILDGEKVKVTSKQPYYVADQLLVLYYPLYAITPYSFGFPLFPIPVYQLESLLREDTPLARMLGAM